MIARAAAGHHRVTGMADHRDPAWWQAIAERWQAAVAAWGLLAAGVGGVTYKGVRWWRRIRRAARGGDSERPPPAEPHRCHTPPGGYVDGDGMVSAVAILAERLRLSERTCEALEVRLRESERMVRHLREELDAAKGELADLRRRCGSGDHRPV